MQLPTMTSQDKNKQNSLQWLVERTPLLLSGSHGGWSRGRRRWMKKRERRGLLLVVDCGTAERENKRG